MKRKPSPTSTPAAAMLSAGVMMATGAAAQPPKAPAPKAPPMAPMAPMAPMPQAAPPARKPAGPSEATGYTIKFAGTFMKWRGGLSVAGMMNGRPVFRTPQGEFFQVDAATGNLQFHSAESLGFLKLGTPQGRAGAPRNPAFLKWEGMKGEQRVSVLGVDAQGHVIQENSRGERFYLGPFGDMVFVK